ncbi:hypothetical protein PhCBS80983_g00581 [Powellomyces hirtus]|uniref:Velvet domain-containing protein n=1 Tax=Powellomyces hirtus TaxID=109895 RepID=A0A507EGT8_9FUNG|nr:hypothetical protein PhCBS80983_g00581 [Powellomyces hirtus]
MPGDNSFPTDTADTENPADSPPQSRRRGFVPFQRGAHSADQNFPHHAINELSSHRQPPHGVSYGAINPYNTLSSVPQSLPHQTYQQLSSLPSSGHSIPRMRGDLSSRASGRIRATSGMRYMDSSIESAASSPYHGMGGGNMTASAPLPQEQGQMHLNQALQFPQQSRSFGGNIRQEEAPTPPVVDRSTMFARQMNEESSDIRYELVVIQQPLRARMCGFGGRGRRLVDPPPIVQLVARHLPSNRVIDQSVTDPPLLVLHALLYDAEAKSPNMIIETPRGKHATSGYMNALTGCLVSSAYSLSNLNGRQGVFFLFGDLSVRVEGRFSFVFKLCSIASAESSIAPGVPPKHLISTDVTSVITQTHTDPFPVYTAKEFPGMLESTPLTRCFSRQGVRLPIRGERRRNLRKLEADSIADDNPNAEQVVEEANTMDAGMGQAAGAQ